MIERSGEQDKPLFTFYEETIFDAGRIIYFDDIGKSRWPIEGRKFIYEFKDGTFD